MESLNYSVPESTTSTSPLPSNNQRSDPSLLNTLEEKISIYVAKPIYGNAAKLKMFLVSNEESLQKINIGRDSDPNSSIVNLCKTALTDLKNKENLSSNDQFIKTAIESLMGRPPPLIKEEPKPVVMNLTEQLNASYAALAESKSDLTEIDIKNKIRESLKSLALPKQVEGEERESWSGFEVTSDERDHFYAMLHDRKGSFGTLTASCTDLQGPLKNSLYKDDLSPIPLPSGNVLEVEEQVAIKLYTTQFYRAINQGIRNHPIEFPAALKYLKLPVEEKEKIQEHVIECGTVLASGLNKLPPYKGIIIRGTALSEENLKKYQEGNIVIEQKFLSWSVDSKVCKEVAFSCAQDYSGCSPVMLVCQSETSKSIADYSLLNSEAERLYPPGTPFLVSKVEEGVGELDGVKIIHMREITL